MRTKADIIEKIKARLAADTNTKHIHEKATIAHVLDALSAVTCDSLTDMALAEGGVVLLPGIGRLEVKARAARRGRNPRTGTEIEIPASWGMLFRAGKELKDALKGVA